MGSVKGAGAEAEGDPLASGPLAKGTEALLSPVWREIKDDLPRRPEVALWPVERLIDVVREDSPFYGPLIIIGYQVSPHGGAPRPGDNAAEVRYFPLIGLPQLAFGSHRALIDTMARRSR